MTKTDSRRRRTIVPLVKRENIDKEHEALLSKRTRLLAEIADLDARILEVEGLQRDLAIWFGEAPADRRIKGLVKQVDMMTEVLRDAKDPLGVSEIVAAVESRYGVRLKRTTISSMLTKMKSDQKLENANGKWSLK